VPTNPFKQLSSFLSQDQNFYLEQITMSPLKAFPVLLASTLACTIPVSALAQSTTESTLLAQTSSSDVLTDLEEQPDAPEDLVIEGLTDDQAAEIVAIFETYQPQIDAATDDYLAALSVFNDLLVPETSDLALTDARNNVVETEQVIDDLIFQRNLEIRAVLSQDQRQVINDYLRAWLGIGPADPVAVFPMTLIGQDINTALPELEADGWEEVVRTPSLVELDRGNEELDLDLQRGEIVGAEFRD
jgi:Spy/CpxP family protein refolding chaperone